MLGYRRMTEQAAAEKDGTVGNDENLIKPPSPTSTLSTTATIINDQPNKIEEYVDSAPRGREDDTLEGSEIKTSSNFDNNWSDTSSEDEESDIIFQTCSSTNSRRFDKSSTSYNRPEGSKTVKDDQKVVIDTSETSSEALKPLRFSYHRTAFDVDIDELDETPWREHHTDISDYFNYGFNETTWNLYCAKQLKIRADRGDGPSQSVQLPPVPASVPVPVPSDSTNANELQSAMFLNQLQNTAKAPPPTKTLVPGGQYLPLPPTSMLHKATQNQQSSSNTQPPPHSSSHSRHGDHKPYSSPSRGSHSDYHSDDRYDNRDRYSKRGRYDR